MPFRPRPQAIRHFLSTSMTCLALMAGAAWSFPVPVSTVTVYEYYNVPLGHYFLAVDPAEMAAIEAGSAGAGWSRTGWAFRAYPAAAPAGTYCPADCGRPVSRFYGTPGLGPNSHFYTADPDEAAGLRRPGSGWTFEGDEFSIPVPDASGQCADGGVPVYRLYNNRWMFNDSNHRYVTDAGERARMRAAGWIDEGARFCAVGASQVPIKSYVVSVDLGRKTLPSSVCEDEAVNLGPCMAVNNLPTPTVLFPPTQAELMPAAFFDRTGMRSSFVYLPSPAPASLAADGTFVQGAAALLGIHVNSAQRGSSAYSSVNPLYQFRTSVAPGAFDARFFPWGAHESAVQLAVSFTLNVKTIDLRSAGSAAYGHPTLEFIDGKSGRHLYFTVLTYGTVEPADYLAPDVATGKVIVGTTFRPDTPFGRSLGLPTLRTPSGFVSPNSWGWGGDFEFRMDRGEFHRVLDAARSVDAALSPDPADYLVDNFHFNNEVFGDGDIGINIDAFTLQLLRR